MSNNTKKSDFLKIIPALLLGALLAFAVRYALTYKSTGELGEALTQTFAVINELTTGAAFWVFMLSVVAYVSKRPAQAVIRALAFSVGALLCWSIWSLAVGTTLTHIGRDLVLCAAAAVYGLIVYYAGNKGPIGAICAAVPTGVLTALGWGFFSGFALIDGTALLFALIAWFIMPRGLLNRILALVLGVGLGFALAHFGVIGLLYF